MGVSYKSLFSDDVVWFIFQLPGPFFLVSCGTRHMLDNISKTMWFYRFYGRLSYRFHDVFVVICSDYCWVRQCPHSPLLADLHSSRFMVGTCLVESIVNQLGCFDLTSNHSSWIPRLSFSCLSIRKPGNNKIGYSPSQARHVALLVSSILHGMFFVMMGSRGGFWVVFGAYAVAAFARSILTGKLRTRKRGKCSYWRNGSLNSITVNISKHIVVSECWRMNGSEIIILHQDRNNPLVMLLGCGVSIALFQLSWLLTDFCLFLGLGGVASPLLCQSLIAINVPWFKFYLGSLVLSAINVAMLVSTFKPTEREFMRDRQNAIILASKYESETSWSKDISSLKDIECMPTSHSQSEKIATNTKGMPSSMQRIMGTDRRVSPFQCS